MQLCEKALGSILSTTRKKEKSDPERQTHKQKTSR